MWESCPNTFKNCTGLTSVALAGPESHSTVRLPKGYAVHMGQACFRHPHRVTYADCTAGNHIYYARYLHLLEAARNEFLRSLGEPFLEWQNEDTLFPVVECHVRYRSPAHYDDLLAIEVWPTLAERVRLNFAYRILSQSGALIILEAETCHVCATLQEKPKRLPEALRVKLLPLIPAPSD